MFLPSNITLKFGDTGDFVAELQRRLANVKAYPEGQVNGFFDGTTVNGVSAFQTRCGIRADGVAGPETLRRLNAAITGTSSGEESSGGSSNQEEDAKAAAANMARGFYVMDNQLAGAPPPMDIHGNTPGQQGWGGHETQAAPAAMSEQQLVQQQLMREAQQHQPQGMSPDQVAQNLQQQAQMQQQMLAQQQQQIQQQLMQQPQPDPIQQQLQAQQMQAQQLQAQQQMQAQQLQPQVPPQALAQAAAPQAEPAKGLVGRAMEKMDALVQRLANYFEAKLPPDVLRDVKNIGHTMLQSGVKESAIPSGPEQARAQQLPTRGPDQSQTPQRG